MAMQKHIAKLKATVAFMFVLCLVMPFLASVASISVMATHTHVCYDEYKEVCVEPRLCCRICIRLHDTKNRTQTIYGAVTCRLYCAPVPSLIFSNMGFASLYTNTATLVSLKVRLNN